ARRRRTSFFHAVMCRTISQTEWTFRIGRAAATSWLMPASSVRSGEPCQGSPSCSRCSSSRIRAISFSMRSVEQQCTRILDQLLDAHEEANGLGTVDDAVVVGEGGVHHRPQRHLTVVGNGTLLNLVQPENRDLRRVENRRTEKGSEHAAVRDRKC